MKKVFEVFVADGACADAVEFDHAFFGVVEEVVLEVLVPGGEVHGGEGPHAYGKGVHV